MVMFAIFPHNEHIIPMIQFHQQEKQLQFASFIPCRLHANRDLKGPVRTVIDANDDDDDLLLPLSTDFPWFRFDPVLSTRVVGAAPEWRRFAFFIEDGWPWFSSKRRCLIASAQDILLTEWLLSQREVDERWIVEFTIDSEYKKNYHPITQKKNYFPCNISSTSHRMFACAGQMNGVRQLIVTKSNLSKELDDHCK